MQALLDHSAELLDGRHGLPDRHALDAALARIANGADELDRHPAFPHDAFRELAGAGVLGATLPGPDGRRIPFADELRLVREVSRADGSVGRILDGHFNAVERLTVACADTLEDGDHARIAAGDLLLGVWGADPGAGEGEPARLHGARLDGVKTFCSGAGGVQRALVVARDQDGERRLAYVDLSQRVSIDRSWYRGEGLRASESHRVVFDGALVPAVLGGPGEASREPWFSRDAIRTSATWAGIADSVLAAALSFLRARGEPGEIAALAAGRMRVAVATIDRWIDHAAKRAEATSATARAAKRAEATSATARAIATPNAGPPVTHTAIEARWAIAAAARELAAEAALACGSRPLATGGTLSRGRRDLDLFLLQHRLEPLLARHGAAAIGGEGP
ncbi:MAG TPA: acyl-CoA dehydrogenase family protein [Solirubrobacteraceae bacterium]|jgi:alkylation response protein AidB-like acyl-CoA dehydrogenase|nr:acyl-CoA dehydrogenase family protein [Solirubrobacteraceae bacterium]